jgi:hypothetical protein
VDIGAKLVPIAIFESSALCTGLNATGFPLRSVTVVRRYELEHGLPDQFRWPITKDVFPRCIGVTDSTTLVDQKDAIWKTIGQSDRIHIFEDFHGLPLLVAIQKTDCQAPMRIINLGRIAGSVKRLHKAVIMTALPVTSRALEYVDPSLLDEKAAGMNGICWQVFTL